MSADAGWLQRLTVQIGRPRMPSSGARLVSVSGQTVRAPLPVAAIGDLCRLRGASGRDDGLAEVVAIDESGVTLFPFGATGGLTREHVLERIGDGQSVCIGPTVLGSVIDGLGRPLREATDTTDTADAGEADGAEAAPQAKYAGQMPSTGVLVPLLRDAPNPLTRAPVSRAVGSGVRAIDALLTIGRGQRLGIFAAAGMGKTSLLGMLARGCDADVCVIALIGERGREVREFRELEISPALCARCVLVVAGAERPAVERRRAAWLATALAEHFRSAGQEVLLIMDSLTRFARAAREIGLAAGEPPTRRGYPPSVFAQLPQLLERAGNDDKGSVTAIYTVLVEGDDMNEPVADEVRSLLDGHIVLSAEQANAGHFPAINVLRSVSRVMHRVTSPAHQAEAQRLRALLAKYADISLLVSLGEYKRGNDCHGDEALDRHDAALALLRQPREEVSDFDDALRGLSDVLA